MRRGEPVDREQIQRGRAVDQNEIVVGGDLARARPSAASRAARARPARPRRRRARGSRACRSYSPARRAHAHLGDARRRRAAPGRPSPRARACRRRCPSSRCPADRDRRAARAAARRARLAARLTPVVVLPTPPFWFVIARMRVTARSQLGSRQHEMALGASPGTASAIASAHAPRRRAAARAPRTDRPLSSRPARRRARRGGRRAGRIPAGRRTRARPRRRTAAACSHASTRSHTTVTLASASSIAACCRNAAFL